MHVVVIGATSTIAVECEKLWAAMPDSHLSLVGRNAEALNKVAEDLKIRYPRATIEVHTCDFADPVQVQAVIQQMPSIDK